MAKKNETVVMNKPEVTEFSFSKFDSEYRKLEKSATNNFCKIANLMYKTTDESNVKKEQLIKHIETQFGISRATYFNYMKIASYAIDNNGKLLPEFEGFPMTFIVAVCDKDVDIAQFDKKKSVRQLLKDLKAVLDTSEVIEEKEVEEKEEVDASPKHEKVFENITDDTGLSPVVAALMDLIGNGNAIVKIKITY